MMKYMQKYLQQVDLMENVDLSTTYLGRIDMKREEVMKVEESFSHFRSRICYG